MNTVVGIDLSLRSTGIAVIHSDGAVTTRTVTSTGKADDDLAAREHRLYVLTQRIVQNGRGYGSPPLVVIEQPAFSRTVGSQHDRSGLWWFVVRGLVEDGCRVVEVSPTARATYATGKGNAAKDRVLAAVVRRYPGVEVDGNDQADALVLAAMGARHLGRPIDDPMPATHLRAMSAVRWPVGVAA